MFLAVVDDVVYHGVVVVVTLLQPRDVEARLFNSRDVLDKVFLGVPVVIRPHSGGIGEVLGLYLPHLSLQLILVLLFLYANYDPELVLYVVYAYKIFFYVNYSMLLPYVRGHL